MAYWIEGGYNPHMDTMNTSPYIPQTRRFADFMRNHAAAVALGLMMLLALPAYLSAMEGQFIDMEFLASLCGISGWGS